MSMTREGAIETIKVALYQAVQDPPGPSNECGARAAQLLDDLESYVARRQAEALEWAADQSVCAAIDTDAHGTAEERTSLRAWAHEARRGSLPTGERT